MMERIRMTGGNESMIKLDSKTCIIGFDDGYQLGKTANFIFDNGVHMLGSAEPTLEEHSLFYDGEYFKVGEGRAAITEDKISDESAKLRTMVGIAMELRNIGLHKAEIVLAVGLPFSNYGRDKLSKRLIKQRIYKISQFLYNNDKNCELFLSWLRDASVLLYIAPEQSAITFSSQGASFPSAVSVIFVPGSRSSR